MPFLNPALDSFSFGPSRLQTGWGTSLVIPWLRILASIPGGTGSISGQGTKILRAMQPKNELKKQKVALKKKCGSSINSHVTPTVCLAQVSALGTQK